MLLKNKLDNGEYLKIKVVPNSGKNEIIGESEDGYIKIRIKGIPEKGKVNTELIKFLSKELKVNKDKIKIISGKTSRVKLIKILL